VPREIIALVRLASPANQFFSCLATHISLLLPSSSPTTNHHFTVAHQITFQNNRHFQSHRMFTVVESITIRTRENPLNRETLLQLRRTKVPCTNPEACTEHSQSFTTSTTVKYITGALSSSRKASSQQQLVLNAIR
jgi:hypothetical protein